MIKIEKIELIKADFISVKCKKCGGEINIPFGKRGVNFCGVCGAGFGVSVVRYIDDIANLPNDEFVEISIIKQSKD
ncbi:hypothetical protein F1B92_04520 [Campylobacter sp. FMV-PI01]|uniref:Uncharacterized protein n=1 Tax=Campylobacter portucalensis TaxID=2608384 RepID=A0A6L5WHB5_9BACT|nr:hypothetical protein [Campylobacter portucalensis]MSN96444.1 hypothetical protein [Campylobacter portucalensis]